MPYPTTYEKHMRVSMLGVMGGGEQFSMNFGLASDQADWWTTGLAAFADEGETANLADDCADWFGSAAAHISAYCQLRVVKIAFIGEDGLYEAPPVEHARVVNGEWIPGALSQLKPHQFAARATFYTDGDLGRVKGGFYIPQPGYEIQGDGLFTAADATTLGDSVHDLIAAVNNEAGFDVFNLRVVVPSQGRYHYSAPGVRSGTKVPPANWDVKRVGVGRRPDVIRRRANALPDVKYIHTVE